MSKEEVISEIRRRNQSAPEPFLAAFPTQQLADYLCRLTASGSTAGLIRSGSSPAITCRLH